MRQSPLRYAFALSLTLGLVPFGNAGNPGTARAQEKLELKQSAQIETLDAIGDAIQPILATDIDGNAFDLRRYAANHPVVIALTSTSCPLCKKYSATLARLEQEYAGKGIRFVFVGSITSDSVDDARSLRDRLQLAGPYVLGYNGEILRKLGAKTTTEAILIDSSLEVIYRGAVDDQYGVGFTKPAAKHEFLKEAIDATLAGNSVEVSKTSAPGCAIMPPKEKQAAELEFYSDIFPIVQAHCVTCHRANGVAPFALQTPDEVIAHAGMIQQVVTNKTMPPWFAEKDEQQPHRWMNDANIPESDRDRLLAWIDGDQTVGEPHPQMIARKFESRWTIGEPDFIGKLPKANAVNATGFMDYIHQKIELPFSEERWIQSVEIRPTSPEVVHHVLVYYIPKNAEKIDINESSHFLAAYAPGNTAQIFTSDFAKRLPANSALVVQMHYTPNGEATTDQTEIAFRFADAAPKHEVMVRGIADTDLNIPPGSRNHREQGELKVKSDAIALAFFPHMHLRGKSFQFELVKPDNTTENLLRVPAYDFNWQIEYRLQTPLPIEKGSKILVTGWFDNSEDNPANPAPNKTVHWGEQTTDEMLIGYVEYYLDAKSAKNRK